MLMSFTTYILFYIKIAFINTGKHDLVLVVDDVATAYLARGTMTVSNKGSS